jgi:hypothetical protein
MTGGVRADVGRIPWWLAAGLVLLALAVLVIRAVALLVCLIADGALRVELAATTAAGIGPLSGSTIVIPGKW